MKLPCWLVATPLEFGLVANKDFRMVVSEIAQHANQHRDHSSSRLWCLVECTQDRTFT